LAALRVGIYLQARLEDKKKCILVLIGATPEGRKELIGFTDGARESAQDWRELLLDLKRRGLDARPELAIADGALGFWKAAGEVWPTTREQRCWVHKTANVLAKLPKSQQPKAKRALQEIWMAETKATRRLIRCFHRELPGQVRESHRMPDQGSRCAADFLRLPRRALKALAHHEPHRKHVRNRAHRTIRSKGCLSNRTALAMVFKLVEAAQKTWRRLDGNNQLPKLILGVKFADGLEVAAKPANRHVVACL
jgi:transposase-like protein